MRAILLVSVFSASAAGNLGAQGAPAARTAVDPSLLSVLKWRLIGPFRGGKSIAVAGHPTKTAVFYMGATTGGGVWRTDDAGTTWYNISDGFFTTTTISAVAISASNPDILYVGTGDVSFRTNVSRGDGLYRSDDGGKTWRRVGLEETRNIARIAIHPRDPDVVYVAVQGHHFVPSPHRGIYRSRDGGKTWEKVLFVGDEYGFISLVMDWSNPSVLYAASWNGRRFPWTVRDAGPKNGIWKTVDGGDTWQEITSHPGLPAGVKGRISLDISQSRPSRIWALMTAEGDGKSGLYKADAPGQADWKPCRDYYCSGNGLYRSDDGGSTWERVRDDPNFFQRPFYYTNVAADPSNPETVYVMNVSFWRSTDGGRTFRSIRLPHGDSHDLWIDPRDPNRMINANDGGATITLNGGRSWSTVDNQPTSQLYNATVDDAFPYHVCAPQQDNSSICVPSRSDYGSIGPVEWRTTGAGENGGIAVDPQDPEVTYGGDHHWMSRQDLRTGQRRWISPWPENFYGHGEDRLRYRWVWDFKVFLSPHDRKVLYAASNVVHRSTDEGASWAEISPDLTFADRTTFEKTPPSDREPYWSITRENAGVEWYAAITSLAESRIQAGVLWAGSNDGLVHVSRDGGKAWDRVTPPELKPHTWVTVVEPSAHEPASAYLVANRHMLGDDRPMVYKTEDYGKSWRSLAQGFPPDDFVWVVREDSQRRGLLYAGAEWSGVYVSFDDGTSWQPLRLNLPIVPVRDLKVKDGDLVAATHGRSFWILDDLSPLHQLKDEPAAGDVRLFKPRTTVRFRENLRAAFELDGAEAENPPNGVVIRYHFARKPAGEVRLSIHDARGNEIRSFSNAAKRPAPGPDLVDPAELVEPGLPVEAGANVFVWDMRYPDPLDWVPKTLYRHRDPYGPLAVPGRYEARLAVDGTTYAQAFEIVKDPRISTTQAEFQEQFDFLMALREKINEDHRAVQEIHDLRRTIMRAMRASEGSAAHQRIAQAGAALDRKLWTLEDELRQFRPSLEHRAKQEFINWPVRIDDKFAKLMEFVEGADYAPTARDREVFRDLSRRLDEQVAKLRDVLRGEGAAFLELMRGAGIS
ncbi:MAG: glycosyl hydrolase [Gemmatimonadetes bacterium]|nr:glycosyl hydrolase [Gemmatimonadota bacterium]